MNLRSSFDALTADTLQRAGSMKWTRFEPAVIPAFVAEMDFGTAPAVQAALRTAVDAASFGYLPTSLARAMAEACAGWQHDAYGWPAEPERIHPVADVLRALELAIEHFSAPASPVILPVPAYMPFLGVPGRLGRRILAVDVAPGADGRYHIDLDGLHRAFAAGGNLLVLTNPHNPLGRVFERAELLAVAEVVDRYGGRVLADEVHAPIVYSPHRHLPYASLSSVTAAHTITATSASKAWNLPGLKCAQLILTADDDEARWQEIGSWAEHGVSTFGVVANTAVYRSGKPWLDEVIAYLDRNRRLLAELIPDACPGAGYSEPEGTYLAWLDCRALGLEPSPSQVFYDQAKVALVDGAECGRPGHVRMTFATPRPILCEMLRRMAGVVRGPFARDRRLMHCRVPTLEMRGVEEALPEHCPHAERREEPHGEKKRPRVEL